MCWHVVADWFKHRCFTAVNTVSSNTDAAVTGSRLCTVIIFKMLSRSCGNWASTVTHTNRLGISNSSVTISKAPCRLCSLYFIRCSYESLAAYGDKSGCKLDAQQHHLTYEDFLQHVAFAESSEFSYISNRPGPDPDRWPTHTLILMHKRLHVKISSHIFKNTSRSDLLPSSVSGRPTTITFFFCRASDATNIDTWRRISLASVVGATELSGDRAVSKSVWLEMAFRGYSYYVHTAQLLGLYAQ